MVRRTRVQMEQAINELLTLSGHKVSSSKMHDENHYQFTIDGIQLTFTPYDSDKTLSWGLWNHGFLRT